jgi:hypothetical protein
MGPESSEVGRTLRWTALDGSLRALVAALCRGQRGGVVAASTNAPLVRGPVLGGFLALAIVVYVALCLRHFGDSCRAEQPAWWVLWYGLGAWPLALVLTHRVLTLARATGTLVTEHDLVLVARGWIRVVPLSSIVGVSGRASWWRDGVELTVWSTCELPRSLVLAPDRAAAVSDAIRYARLPLGLGYRSSQAEDPLSELKRSAAWTEASHTPPPRREHAAWLIAVAVVACMAPATWLARNTASVALAAEQVTDWEGLRCLESSGVVAEWYSEHERAAFRSRVTTRMLTRAIAEADHARLLELVRAGGLDPAERQRALETLYRASRGDATRLRSFLADFPDAPRASETRSALAACSLDEARARDDVQAYAYVLRESVDTEEAGVARALRQDRYDRVLEALTVRHGRSEPVEVLTALVRYIEAHELEQLWVRVVTRVEGDAASADALSQTSVELREIILHDRARAALAELLPTDILPVAVGAPLPRRSHDDQRAAIVALATEGSAAERLARLVKKEDDGSGRPELRIEHTVLTSQPNGAMSIGSRFAMELRTPTVTGELRRWTFSIDVAPREVRESIDAVLTDHMDRVERQLEEAWFSDRAPG